MSKDLLCLGLWSYSVLTRAEPSLREPIAGAIFLAVRAGESKLAATHQHSRCQTLDPLPHIGGSPLEMYELMKTARPRRENAIYPRVVNSARGGSVREPNARATTESRTTIGNPMAETSASSGERAPVAAGRALTGAALKRGGASPLGPRRPAGWGRSRFVDRGSRPEWLAPLVTGENACNHSESQPLTRRQSLLGWSGAFSLGSHGRSPSITAR